MSFFSKNELARYIMIGRNTVLMFEAMMSSMPASGFLAECKKTAPIRHLFMEVLPHIPKKRYHHKHASFSFGYVPGQAAFFRQDYGSPL